MSIQHYFMGIDTGTNSSKGVIIDQNCEIIATHSTEHIMTNPRPGYYEHDAEKDWWGDFCIISKALIEKSTVNPNDILAVGISALGADCLPVDENCNPLRQAILYGIDSRAVEEIKQLTEMYGEIQIKKWYGRPNPELCAPICRPEQLAEILEANDIAGHVTEKAALETGLAVGTPVITGTDDSGTEAISVGVVSAGKMMIQFGSSIYMILGTKELVDDDRLWRENFIVPNLCDISAGTNTAGSLTKWYRDHLFRMHWNRKIPAVKMPIKL